MFLFDGFVNLVTRLGTRFDKSAHGTYSADREVTAVEIDAAYRTSWFSMICDIPPDDEIREWRTWTGASEAFSWPGLVIALIAIPAMRYLAYRKLAIAEKIGSRALRADAMEAVACGWLSFVVVATLAIQWLFGAWWIDSVGSLAIVYFLVKEGREALSGDECDCCRG